VRGLRQATLAVGRDHVRADQDRALPLVPGDLSGDLQQGWDLGDGAEAPDGLRQLPDRLDLAAQDPKGHGQTGAAAAGRARRGGRDLRRRAAAGHGAAGKVKVKVAGAVESGRGKPKGRRLGRLRLAVVADASARSLEGFLSQNVARPATVATDGWSGYLGLDAAGYRHEPLNLSASWGDAALRLPAIHLVFGLAKRWLLGTHHGAVGKKHLPAYLDEFVFRFNRRTAKSISHRFARLIEHAVQIEPITYHALVTKSQPA
jgi:transposase-like protein